MLLETKPGLNEDKNCLFPYNAVLDEKNCLWRGLHGVRNASRCRCGEIPHVNIAILL